MEGTKFMKKYILIALAAGVSGCQSTRYETFQGEPIELKSGEVLVKSRHSHNLEIWLRNQNKKIGGGATKKSDELCPQDLGHGPMAMDYN